MREIFTKIKGFSHHLSGMPEFEDYSLSMDRFDKLISQVGTENLRAQEEKKDIVK
jgi:hypothetical protein